MRQPLAFAGSSQSDEAQISVFVSGKVVKAAVVEHKYAINRTLVCSMRL